MMLWILTYLDLELLHSQIIHIQMMTIIAYLLEFQVHFKVLQSHVMKRAMEMYLLIRMMMVTILFLLECAEILMEMVMMSGQAIIY